MLVYIQMQSQSDMSAVMLKISNFLRGAWEVGKGKIGRADWFSQFLGQPQVFERVLETPVKRVNKILGVKIHIYIYIL